MDGPDFATLLRNYRRQSGLTQEELAERADLSMASVSLLERGVTQALQKATVEMLSAALALPPEEAAEILAKARKPYCLENGDAPHASAETTYDAGLAAPVAQRR
jgi:transcriptional regulator with XRE-family HTH domain